MKIDGREIGFNHPPYVIAELGASHNGSIDRCMRLMQEARRIGADAIKLQAYTPDTITFDGDGPEFTIQAGPWKGRKLHELYAEAHTPFEWMKPLMDFGRILQIPVFASVFDQTSLELLERLDCPAYKIASFEITDIPLIREVGKTDKPCIISTGMANYKEIMDAYNAYKAFASNISDLALLHCVSAYPTSPAEANLPALGPLSSVLGGKHQVGISDHTLGLGVPVAAVAYGACLIEKHLTLDRGDGGPDAAFSSEPHEFAAMVKAVKEAWQATRPTKALSMKSQDPMRAYRRSLYVVGNVSKGEILTKEKVRSIRPANGLSPSFYDFVLGLAVNQDLTAGTPLSLSHFASEELSRRPGILVPRQDA